MDTKPPAEPVLELEGLTVEFETPRGTLRAVDGVSLRLDEGRSLGIVGESGSGKSVLARAVMGLLAANGTRRGTIRVVGRDVDRLGRVERRHFWGVEVAMVFQDPMTALSPLKRIGAQLTEALRYHRAMSRGAARLRAVELMEQVQIPEPRRRLRQYPHELSGGMRQRVVIAMALACGPRLLIADEPTTALDVTVQKRILDLLDDLRRGQRMSLLLITHDLAVAEGRCDDVAVMYAGRLVERGTAVALFDDTRHPYTEALLRARPDVADTSHTRLFVIPGRPPDLIGEQSGCTFAPRCRFARPDCLESEPPVGGVPGIHEFACRHPVGTERGDAALAANEAAGRTAAGTSMWDGGGA